MVLIAKWTLILFGLFFIAVGILMFLSPDKARSVLKKAGSTNFINYAEISLRMIPAAAMIIYADHSMYPGIFWIMGWFMIATSLILYFVPRKLHHGFALRSAEKLKLKYVRLIAPFSVLAGMVIIYAVI